MDKNTTLSIMVFNILLQVTKKGSEQHKVAAKSDQEFKKKLVKDGDFAVLNEIGTFLF